MKYLPFLIGLIFLSCQNKGEEAKPNILLIIADDLGYADMSFLPFSPGDVHTPHLDQIAGQGTYFSNAYATSPICSPSRTGLITGRHQARWGNYWYGEGGLPAEELTIPQLLVKAGYRTYKIGKTHMNGGPVHHPLEHGFGEFLGFIDHTWDYLRLTERDVEAYGKENAKKAHLGPLIHNHQQVSYPDDYTTDIFTRKAVDIIETESEQPFYIHLSYNAVHHPTYVCHPDYLGAYGIEQFPFWDPQEEPYQEWHSKWGHLGEVDPDGRKRYLLQLQVMDEGIGQILQALQSTDKLDNTLILFLSDNGGTINTYANNQPLNGYKYMFGEGGIRIPLLISWPGHFPGNDTEDALVSAMDIFPSLAEIAGEPHPGNFDGVSLVSLLNGQATKVHESLFFSNGRDSWVVRHGPWKLAHNIQWDHSSFRIVDGQCVRDSAYHYPGGTLLYNLEKEIAEQSDLSGLYPEMVDSLQTLYTKWRKQMADPTKPQSP
jgi:arylsulfatase A-like enzyme